MAKIRQFWMVVPLDIKEDPHGGKMYATMPDMAMDAEPARPARLTRAEPQVTAGYGFKILGSELKRINMAFTNRQLADDYAKEQAEKSPKTLFGVFACDGTFETTTPTIIRKAFNEDGELTPIKS